MFKDRVDAGRLISKHLQKYKDREILILGLPMGGIELGYEIADTLQADFSILVASKLRQFITSGMTFGAVSEDGNFYYSDLGYDLMHRFEMDQILELIKKEIPPLITTLRGNTEFPDVTGKTIVLTDESATTGYLLKVAAEMCKSRGARKIIAAIPVADTKAVNLLKNLVDELIVLDDFDSYSSIREVYSDWHELSEEEAILIWERWQLLKNVESGTITPAEIEISIPEELMMEFRYDFEKD